MAFSRLQHDCFIVMPKAAMLGRKARFAKMERESGGDEALQVNKTHKRIKEGEPGYVW